MKTLRRVLLVWVALLLFLFSCALPFLFTVHSSLLRPGFYLDLLEQEGVFEATAARVREYLTEQLPVDASPEEHQLWEEVAALVSPARLRELSGAALDRVLGFVAGRYPDPVFTISLAEVKDVIARAILAQPPARFAEAGLPAPEELLAGLDEEVPDEWSVAEAWATFPQREDAIRGLRLARLAGLGVWLGAATLLILCLLLGGLYGGSRWGGGALLLSGLTMLAAVTLATRPGLALLGTTLETPALLPFDLTVLAAAALGRLAGTARLAALAQAGAGLALWLAAPALRRRRSGFAGRDGSPRGA